MDLSVSPPVFQTQKPKDKYQVRFWSQPTLYNKFVCEVERNELVIQDVFNQFMEWFTQASEEGVLPKRETVVQG